MYLERRGLLTSLSQLSARLPPTLPFPTTASDVNDWGYVTGSMPQDGSALNGR